MGPVLEINLISAQDLAHVSRNMKTYAIAWINTDPTKKFTTRVDQNNQANPIWNEKFVFHINDYKILDVDASVIVIEIYAAAWSKDALIGTVNVNLTDVFTPWSGFYDGDGGDGGDMRLVTLEIRRPSGRLQGFLKLGISFIDGGQRSLPLSIEVFNGSQLESNCDQTDLTADVKTEVVVTNGGRFSGVGVGGGGTDSMVNDSICNSDIGPSASVVAAAIAQGLYNRQKTTAKTVSGGGGNKDDASERWRTVKKGAVVATKKDKSGDRKQRRRNGGLFSCFGNVLGCEISITCGGESGGEGESTKKRYNNKNNKIVNLSDVDETLTHSTS